MNSAKKILAILLVALLAVSSVFAADWTKHITVIGTSDMHGNIWGYSYEDPEFWHNNYAANAHSRLIPCIF